MTRDIPDPGPSVFRRATLFALLLVIACGGGGDPAADGGGAIDASPGPDGQVAPATEFVANPAGVISLVEGYTGPEGLSAFLRDRPDVPPAALLASEGECEIWTHPVQPARCDPPCEDGFCIADDRCEPFPVPVSAGEIAVTGLAGDLRFVPGEFGYTPDPALLPDDIFTDGAAIAATASGDGAPGFSLAATGVATLAADLDLEFDVTLVIEDGVDEVIRWAPESSGTIELALQVGHHGAPYEALLVCESDDDGELVVPGPLIESLPRQSNGLEQHASWIARFTREVTATAAGPLELFVASRQVILQIDHR